MGENCLFCMPNKVYNNILYVLEEKDYYKILSVKDNAEISEITKAYKNFAKIYHPDIFKCHDKNEKDEIDLIFRKITSAYNILKDPEKRKDYDYQRRLNEEYKKTLSYSQPSPGDRVVYAKPKPKENTGHTININIGSFSNSASSSTQTQDTSSKDKAKNEHAENLYNKALEKYKSGNLEAAILDLQTCIVLNSKIAKYHSTLGLMLEKKGWEGYAQSEFKLALKFDPKDKIALEHTNKSDSSSQQDSSSKKSKTVQLSPMKNKKSKGLFDSIKGLIDNIFSAKKV